MVKDNETEQSAVAFLQEAAAAFPFRLTHMPTDNSQCLTPAFAKAYAERGAQSRHTRPYTPQTSGMVERFSGRISSEVLSITLNSHRQVEQLLRGFNVAYNARRQRVRDGKIPDQVVAEQLKATPALAKIKARLDYRKRQADLTTRQPQAIQMVLRSCRSPTSRTWTVRLGQITRQCESF